MTAAELKNSDVPSYLLIGKNDDPVVQVLVHVFLFHIRTKYNIIT